MSAVAIPRRIKPHSAASTPARLKTAAWCAIASQVSVVIDLPHSKPPLAASSGARSARPGYGSARLQPNGATGATFAVALLPNPSGAGPTPPPQTAVPAPLRSAARALRIPQEGRLLPRPRRACPPSRVAGYSQQVGRADPRIRCRNTVRLCRNAFPHVVRPEGLEPPAF